MNALSEMNMSNLSKMSSKLSIPLQVKWRDEAQRIRERGQFPTLKELVDFIERQADAANDPIFGRIGESHKGIPRPAVKVSRRPTPNTSSSNGAKVTTLSTQVELPNQRYQPNDSKNTSTSEPSPMKCYICGLAHRIENCSDFISKSVRQRCSQARQKGLCLNCLRKGHFATQCQSKFRCKECQLPHHTLLHKATEEKDASSAPSKPPTEIKTNVKAATVTTSDNKPSSNFASTSSNGRIALQVVPVQVLNKEGHSVSTYALLDTGSEESFVSRNITDKLNIQIDGYDDLAVCTLSGESSVKVGRTDLKVKGVGEEHDAIVQMRDVKVVENLNINTTRPKDISRWSHLKDIIVPDVDVNQVLMLIGANVPEAQIHLEYRTGKQGEPYAVRTSLGWAVLGPIDGKNCHPSNVNINFVKYGSELCDQQMSQFLRLEDADVNRSSKQAMSIEDQESLRRLKESTRVVDGHYEVGMLWKSNNPWLPDNKKLAEARLQSLKKKLERDESFHWKYRDFMNNLLSKGYARKLTKEEANSRSKKTWYLPHHAVFHPQKRDKIRVVFDAAALYDGVSLNIQLSQGPDLSNSLLGVLLRFRQERIALVADIEGMFNQVKVPPEDADALRFLWFENSNLEGAAEYQMTSHIFGAADSPSCANYCLKRVAEDNKGKASEAALSTIENDFYVDDLVKSVRTSEEAKTLASEITTLLGEAGFRLTKWMSNCREVLATIPEEERAKPTLDLDLDDLPIQRTLGVQWDVEEDVFLFKVKDPEKPPTKRGILSAISSLYDPIGFVCPVLLEAKKIIQTLWKLNLGWDDPIPEDLQRHWNRWRQELTSLSKIKIPRVYLINETDIVDVSLHLFADASEDGYGACAYLRFVQANGLITCSFVLGRSRSSPVRPVSMPRLELQAATLSVRIYRMLVDELTCRISRTVFWTDSQTALQYIKNVTKRFQAYVANRVTEIREVTTPDQWRHCPGRFNPADDASRGLKPQKLSTKHRWWRGPEFLWQTEDAWPDTKIKDVPDDDPEVRKEAKIHQVSVKNDSKPEPAPDSSSARDYSHLMNDIIARWSSWSKLQRRVAWLIRFCRWISSDMCDTGPLSLEELNQATNVIVRAVQATCFSDEMSELKKKGEVKKTSPIADLRPLEIDGILRVGGRLQAADNLSLDERHPMILPKRHHVSVLIIRHFHEATAHGGREQTLCETRRQFWIVAGRSLVKDIIRRCIKCRRMNAQPMQQVMAPLPKARVEAYQPPFTYSGVDLFGPLTVKWGRGTAKRWGCLFTCLNTRAVYLDVVPSLEADDFIMILRQFVSRRGPPREIWSDRGTNFVGANNELKDSIAQWNNEKITRDLQQKGIKWVFQPPASPHMSGVWERLVQSVKKHIKAVVGDGLLNDLELRTLLAEVESIVNSRPITAVSDDPKDLTALTPKHFLMQRTAQLPPGVFVKEDQFSRRRWRKVQHLTNQYWQRWIKEYLPNLQKRSKWLVSKQNLKPGDLVLVADDNLTRNRWPLARVSEVFTGRDGRVRSANVKTAQGVLQRPIVKLCLLEEHNAS